MKVETAYRNLLKEVCQQPYEPPLTHTSMVGQTELFLARICPSCGRVCRYVCRRRLCRTCWNKLKNLMRLIDELEMWRLSHTQRVNSRSEYSFLCSCAGTRESKRSSKFLDAQAQYQELDTSIGL